MKIQGRKSKTLTFLLFLATLMLIGVLAFLYQKTLATDSRAQNEALDLLRQLNDIDNHWDQDALRGIASTNRDADAKKILHDLDAHAKALNSSALNAGLPDLRRAVIQKIKRINQLSANAGIARKAYEQLTFLTAGPRIDALTRAFSQEIGATLEEKERFRAYMVAYAGALLLLTGWLVGKLRTANIDLEQRIQKRTHELSDALQNLKESEAQLVQSEKMAALGQMVAGVAHEIHTPLAYVKNSLGTVGEHLPAFRETFAQSAQLLTLLQAGANADAQTLTRQFSLVSNQLAQLRRERTLEELDELVKHGLYGIDQMAEIVGNLKDFSRLDRGKTAHFDLNEGLNNTLALAHSLLKNITIEKRFGDIPEILCAPSQINQVFLNLITNAAQAMEGSAGILTLTTHTENAGIAVKIADTGIGIAPDILPKIFDPFFTTKPSGTGLGLSVSYKIVQEHGGHFDVASELGKGSRFTVWLPLTPPTLATA